MAGVQIMKLSDHLTTVGIVPFEYGVADCCTFACDWVLAIRGVDPMADWRGRYASRVGVTRKIMERGGMIECVSAEMKAAGLEETIFPQPGDVGLVRQVYDGDERIMLAIKTARGWACKGERGLVVAPLETVRAWRV
jgi:hypothetical protein